MASPPIYACAYLGVLVQYMGALLARQSRRIVLAVLPQLEARQVLFPCGGRRGAKPSSAAGASAPLANDEGGGRSADEQAAADGHKRQHCPRQTGEDLCSLSVGLGVGCMVSLLWLVACGKCVMAPPGSLTLRCPLFNHDLPRVLYTCASLLAQTFPRQHYKRIQIYLDHFCSLFPIIQKVGLSQWCRSYVLRMPCGCLSVRTNGAEALRGLERPVRLCVGRHGRN